MLPQGSQDNAKPSASDARRSAAESLHPQGTAKTMPNRPRVMQDGAQRSRCIGSCQDNAKPSASDAGRESLHRELLSKIAWILTSSLTVTVAAVQRHLTQRSTIHSMADHCHCRDWTRMLTMATSTRCSQDSAKPSASDARRSAAESLHRELLSKIAWILTSS